MITPIEGLNAIAAVNGNQKTEKPQEYDGNFFTSIFQSAIQNVKDTQKNLEDKQYLLATGQIDDAHTVPIAAAEAKLSVDLLVELRNKAVDAYNELMRISL